MDIREILRVWSKYQDNIRRFRDGSNAYDIPYFIAQFRELAGFLRENEPFLREWMMEYFVTHRQSIFMKWWRKHVYDWAINSARLHPLAEQEWDTVFGDLAVYRFSTAAKAVEKMKALWSVDHCDDVTILAIHEGLDCTSFPCNYCDEREDAWRCELRRRIIHSQHPLLNPNVKIYGLPQISNLKIYGLPQISNQWSLPHIWGMIKGKICYDLDEYKEHMCGKRVQDRLAKGKTGRECMQNFIWKAFEFRGWGVDRFDVCWSERFQILPKNMKDDYEVFCILWNVVDLISFTVSLDLPWLEEIGTMM